MKYKSKELFIENFNVKTLAEKYSTPLYCYSLKKIKENIKKFKRYFKNLNPLICFAVKANPNQFLIKEIGKLGLGADVVSMGELVRALKSGIKPQKIVFSGVGKTEKELDFAIKKKILLINTESKSEILQIEKIAKRNNKKVNIGIRLNPNTDAKTLSQISTGKKENKFGISEKNLIFLINYIKESDYLNLKCLSVHIGSQILDHKPYEKMLKVVKRIVDKSNHNFEFIDLGGGMGIDYKNNKKKLDLKKYASNIKKILKQSNSRIIFEPGRFIIGNSGLLVSKIIYIKEGDKKDFIILDAAMNDLMRPALYQANHRLLAVKKNSKSSKKVMSL